jgi:hypothetical protein
MPDSTPPADDQAAPAIELMRERIRIGVPVPTDIARGVLAEYGRRDVLLRTYRAAHADQRDMLIDCDGQRDRARVLSGLLRGMARRVVERRAYIGALCSEYDDMRAELRRVRFEWDASEQRVAAVRGAVAGWQEQLDAGEVFAGSPGDAVLCGVVGRLRAVLDGPADPGLSLPPNVRQTLAGPTEAPANDDDMFGTTCAECGEPITDERPSVGEAPDGSGPMHAGCGEPCVCGTAFTCLAHDHEDDEPVGPAEAAEPAPFQERAERFGRGFAAGMAEGIGAAEAGAAPAPDGQLRKLNMDLAAARQVVAAVRRWTLASADEGPSRERQMVAALERHDERVREELRVGSVSTTPEPTGLAAAARSVLAEWDRMHPSGHLAMYPAMDALRAAVAGATSTPDPAAQQFVIHVDSAEPPVGTRLIGPFPSREAAWTWWNAWSAQHLRYSEVNVGPIVTPVRAALAGTAPKENEEPRDA